MAKRATKKSTVEYINNPFWIGVKGINLLFLKAQGIAILVTVISVLSVTRQLNINTEQPAAGAEPTLPTFTPELIALIASIAVVTLLTFFVIGTLIRGVAAYGAAQAAVDKEATFTEAFRAVIANFGSLLWLQLLMAVKILGWSLLFIIPGIIMAVRYSLANVVFFNKGLRGNAAIKESMALTKGSWVTTFAGQTLMSIITLGVLDFLVRTGSSAILYRQFDAVPQEERPKSHGLSIATLALMIVAMSVVMIMASLLIYALINYGTGALDPSQPAPEAPNFL